MSLKIAIVEDNAKIREGIKALIDGSSGFTCVATYGSAEEAIDGLPRLRPDVILMDIHLPKMSGIECVRLLRAAHPDLLFMMLTVYEDDEQIFESLKAGASGYVLKRTRPAALLEAIEELHDGGSPMSDVIARKVVQTFQRQAGARAGMEELSPRETEILAFVARGHQDQEIADSLFLSVKTIRTHLRNIYQKLQVRSRTEAAVKFIRR